MSKLIRFHERQDKGNWSDGNPVSTGERDLCELTARVREVAEERGIDVPKKIDGGGAYCSYFYIKWTSLEVKDLMNEVAEEMGFVLYE